jgi:hypothetical protein
LGAGGNRKDIEVAAEKGNMELYSLPDPPDPHELAKAIRASLKLRVVSKNKAVGYTLLCAIYRAPLGEAYRIDMSLFQGGPTGLQKSEKTALALSHYGPGLDSRHFPASWEDTDTDLELKSHCAKDCIFVVDDFKPKGSEVEVSKLHARADRFFRNVGNQSGRGRRTPTLKARPAYYPRCFPLSSGEDIPRGQSLRARLGILETRHGDTDFTVLTELQRAGEEGLLAQAMAGYIQWLAPRMEELKKTLPETIRAYRKDRGRYTHDRFIDNYANLITGFKLFLEYAEEVGAISAEESAQLEAECASELDCLMHAQADYQADANEAVRFLNLLSSAFSSDRCHLVDLDTQGEPMEPREWGWRSYYGY